MANVVFYEKPGCSGNARQKGLLVAAGHVLEVRDLLAFPWTSATLRPFFGTRPVAEWFNPLAPAVRDGDIDPARFDEVRALAAMIAQPILIRRPLLEVGEERRCGFDPAEVDAWIGLTAGGAAYARRDLERCPKGEGTPPCPPPRP
jgi:nitrogenase-associated protein